MCTHRSMDSSQNCSPDSSTMVKDNVSQPAGCLEELMMSILEDSTQQGTATPDIAVEVEPRPRIQHVPTLLRDIEKTRNCYDPRLVSFGPYHYGKEKLKVGQTLKVKLVQEQLRSLRENRLSTGKSIKDFFNQDFSEVADKARKCYDMGSIEDKFNDQEFKSLIFLDGCFIVYFIHCFVKHEDLKMKNDHIAFIIMDMFLLENQLPYIVLQKLLTTLLPQESIDIFENFINQQTKASGGISTNEPLYNKLFRWLPDYIRSKRTESMAKDTAATTTTVTATATAPAATSVGFKHEPLHLLDLLRSKMLDTSSIPNYRKSQQEAVAGEDNWQSFRSVQELKAAGISIICSRSCCPKTVKFHQNHIFGAELTLPAIVVDDSTKTKWLNLIAYEACPDFSNDLAFTSFVCFMDSLIDHAEDVKELRLNGVLCNCLGSDEDVANLFNEITIDLTPDPTAYGKVKLDIHNHYRNGCGIWWAEALQTNFRTPWTTTAFVVAIFLIILTIFQTYLTVVQTYFSK